MSESLALSFALLAGVLLGAFFFGGLWWTIRKSVTARQPALWFLGSLLLRTTVTLAGFWFVVQGAPHGGWHKLLACLLGFVLARMGATLLSPAPFDKPAGLPGRAAR